MQRLSAETTQEGMPEGIMSTAAEPLPEGLHCTGRVKWFDATRGFGFLVSDNCEGDILVHFSVLKEHGRRSLPEGATVECIAAHQDRRNTGAGEFGKGIADNALCVRCGRDRIEDVSRQQDTVDALPFRDFHDLGRDLFLLVES